MLIVYFALGILLEERLPLAFHEGSAQSYALNLLQTSLFTIHSFYLHSSFFSLYEARTRC